MLIFLPEAKENLKSIATYIARESGDVATASGFVEKLIGKCESLAAQPFRMGTPRPELGDGIRSAVHGNYLIFFRYLEDAMEVALIVEGHRDIEALFHS